MTDPEKQEEKENPAEEKFVEGRDYYFENGLFVLTEYFLLRRGYCCESGCRHCPYGFKNRKDVSE
jgi:uncharacterized protein DUF5522